MTIEAVNMETPVKVEFDNFEHGFPEGFGPGRWGYLAYGIGLAFAVFQLYVAAFNYLPSQVVRGQLSAPGDEELDARGRYVLPGVIDGHVHFRDPGLEHKEDWASGTRAA